MSKISRKILYRILLIINKYVFYYRLFFLALSAWFMMRLEELIFHFYILPSVVRDDYIATKDLMQPLLVLCVQG